MGHVKGYIVDQPTYFDLLKFGVARVINVATVTYRKGIQFRKTIRIRG